MSAIPKVIHYCWFGRGEKSKTIEKCIETWRKHLPEYELLEWNEDNFILADSPRYVQEAYAEKKYAFVSDYVRLYALDKCGGVYMDTDIEVRKNFDTLLDNRNLVVGFEMVDSVMTGLIASVSEHPIIKEFLSYYKDQVFVNADGSYNLQVNPVQFTKIFCEHGLKKNGEHQVLEGGIEIFPVEYFCAFDLHNDHEIATENTYTVHHYTGSWNDATLKKKFFKRKLVSILGPHRYEKIKSIYKKMFNR